MLSFRVDFDVLALDIHHILLTILITRLRTCKLEPSILLIAMPCKVVWLRSLFCVTTLGWLIWAIVDYLRLISLCYLVRVCAVVARYLLSRHSRLIAVVMMLLFRMLIWGTTLDRLWLLLWSWLVSLVLRDVFQLRFINWLLMVELSSVVVLNGQPIVLIIIKLLWNCWLSRLASLVLALDRWLLLLLFLIEVLCGLLPEIARILYTCLIVVFVDWIMPFRVVLICDLGIIRRLIVLMGVLSWIVFVLLVFRGRISALSRVRLDDLVMIDAAHLLLATNTKSVTSYVTSLSWNLLWLADLAAQLLIDQLHLLSMLR